MSSLADRDHVNMSVEILGVLGVLTDTWAECDLYTFCYRNLEPLRNIAFPSNTNNAHIS